MKIDDLEFEIKKVNKEITVRENNEIIAHGFRLHRQGIEALGRPTFAQWQKCGEFLKQAEGSVHFWLGDWLNYGERSYGQKYTQALEATDFAAGTLRDDAWIASRIPLSSRDDNLTRKHAKALAPLVKIGEEGDIDNREEVEPLFAMVKGGATVQELVKAIHQKKLEGVRPPTTTDANLLLGDCLEEMKTLPDGSIDCLITDPPYGIDYQSNFRTATPAFAKIPSDQEGAAALLEAALTLAEKKLKENSHVYIFASWKNYPEFKTIVERHFTLKNLLVWVKNNWSMGDLEGNYAEQYELIIFAAKGRRLLFGDRPTNVLNFDRVGSLEHPTQKPVDLIEFLIANSTQAGEVVLDPFMGVGSTCRAAKNKGRKYVGIEIEEKYYDVACRRLT